MKALWTFLEDEGVEPTGNASGRALRHAVIWRKTSFGSDNGRGMPFFERAPIVTETYCLHKRNLLDHLTSAIVAGRKYHPAPHLIPIGSRVTPQVPCSPTD
jgi:hypothetical protein